MSGKTRTKLIARLVGLKVERGVVANQVRQRGNEVARTLKVRDKPVGSPVEVDVHLGNREFRLTKPNSAIGA